MEEVKALVSQAFDLKGQGTAAYTMQTPRNTVDEEKRVVEKLEVSQGKLNMGLRTGVTYGDNRYAAA
ncbi:hypothetical protein D3C81_2219140 [compost metagenome]